MQYTDIHPRNSIYTRMKQSAKGIKHTGDFVCKQQTLKGYFTGWPLVVHGYRNQHVRTVPATYFSLKFIIFPFFRHHHFYTAKWLALPVLPKYLRIMGIKLLNHQQYKRVFVFLFEGLEKKPYGLQAPKDVVVGGKRWVPACYRLELNLPPSPSRL